MMLEWVQIIGLSTIGIGLLLCYEATAGAGPLVRATRGEVWPKPQAFQRNYSYMFVRPNHFKFKVTFHTCAILDKAIERYKKIISAYSNVGGKQLRKWMKSDPLFHGYLDSLEVYLDTPCEEYPYLNMDELYSLKIDYGDLESKALLVSSSIWGVLRGLETFTQMLTPSIHIRNHLVVNSSLITDFPRFPHRGLLLDTSRHFEPLSVIFSILDGMECNKLNVFHWHIVDDQSFPYQSQIYPGLSEKGAYNPITHVYSIEDIQSVIEYARLRGIRVMPEFDTPGHTQSWGLSIPKLLTPCYQGGELSGTYGPIDPSRKENYKFVKTLFQEIISVFKDNYIHLGGDEVSFDCWSSNPNINQYMKDNNISTYEELESMYIQKVLNYVTNMNANSIVWQEVFQNNVTIQNDTVVHIWLGNLAQLLEEVTSAGHKALISECWYLDHLDKSWIDFYKCEPWNFDGTTEQKKLVLGGEACMWSEMVDESNVVSRIFPRASATAEKLWSSEDTNVVHSAQGRLEEHYCRMKKRGISAQPPTGPGFCPI
uniref:Beta-hexosaminidase n=1 Tax=Clastoptera arizonana TaxID=38151 RepID=A0A1B6CMM3_9HEMI